MKKTIIFIMLLFCLYPVHSQEKTIRILTEKDLSAAERSKYRQSAEDFLEDYYRKLINSNDNVYVMETMVSRYMDSLSREYQPEFTFVRDRSAQPVAARQYLSVLASELHGLDIGSMSYRIDSISILPEFYAPDYSSCFVIAEYTLSLYGGEQLLFSRRCEAYCLFPKGMDFMEVRLLQVRPLQDLVVYRGGHNTSAVVADAGNRDWKSLFDNVDKPGFDRRCIVRLDGKYGVIARDGTIIVPVRYDELGAPILENSVFRWLKNLPIRFCRDGKYGYINTLGQEIVPAQYDYVPEYLDGMTCCRIGDRYGALDGTGRLVIPVKYEKYFYFTSNSGWAATKLHDRYGFIHRDGKRTTPFIYRYAENVYDGRAVVVDDDGLVGFLGRDREVAIPCKYQNIWDSKGRIKDGDRDLYEFNSCGVTIAKMDNRLGLIDTLDRRVAPFRYKRMYRAHKNSSHYKVERRGFKGWLDSYGNEYATEKLCLEGMRRIEVDEQQRLYAQALEYDRSEQYGAALDLFARLADKGNANAMAYLGMYHYNGCGTQPDAEAAVRWYGKAAEKGHPIAMTEMGIFLHHGRGVPKDREKGFSFFTRAAENGDGRGILYLADCYYKGLGTGRDITRALEWYEKAVVQNVKGAKLALAVALYDGTDKPENHIRAFRLLSDPEMADNTKAAMYLGKCHYYGQGTPVKYRTAREYFLKSEKDYAESRYFLGWIYEHGQGVRRNITEAVKWYGKCTGHRDADKRLADLKRKIRK